MRAVIWSDDAGDDYLGIIRHIARDDPFAAEKVADAIARTAGGLGDFATGHPGRVSAHMRNP